VLSVCPGDRDPAYNRVLRTLRVDFDGMAVWFGPDETHQFATDLDPARPGVSVLPGRPVTELAAAAADWLEREMWRPIVRHEWDRLDQRGVAPGCGCWPTLARPSCPAASGRRTSARRIAPCRWAGKARTPN
jgi:hypothetical protein